MILKFEGYDTMTAAEGLVGGRLVISESDALNPLKRMSFTSIELIGAEAVTDRTAEKWAACQA